MKKFRAFDHFGVTKLHGKKLVFKQDTLEIEVELSLHPTYSELIKIQEKFNDLEFVGIRS